MKQCSLMCPDGSWPQTLTGNIAVGIEEISSDTQALWLLFTIKEGKSSRVCALLSNDKGMPDEINSNKPIITAVASRETWELIPKNWATFTKLVADNHIHVSGDIRIFCRFVPVLLQTLRSAPIWHNLDALLQEASKDACNSL